MFKTHLVHMPWKIYFYRPFYVPSKAGTSRCFTGVCGPWDALDIATNAEPKGKNFNLQLVSVDVLEKHR